MLTKPDKCYGYTSGEFARIYPSAAPPPASIESINEQFRALVLSRRFPCVFSKTVVGQNNYQMGAYGKLGTKEAAEENAGALQRFARDFGVRKKAQEFTSFVAVFMESTYSDELQFEEELWRHLQYMHDVDAAAYKWDGRVSDDPHHPDFSFSIGGRAFFMVSLHGAASMHGRRFGWTTLVFNAHEQFQILREDAEAFSNVSELIRSREIRLQGYSNPMITHYGTLTEALQYSGRVTDIDWKCPFEVKSRK